MNLVINAVEAIATDGLIEVSTDWLYVDSAIVDYDKVQQGEYAIMKVKDNGLGIAESDINKIFEPFFSKKEMGQSGSGLGLAVVYGVIQDHGGHINVQSIPQQGTTFTISFPLNKRAPKPEVAPSSDSFHGEEMVLVVDDIEEQRELAQSFLEVLGYKVQGAATGEKAIHYLRHHDVDILVMDMILGDGIDGLETYKRILDFKPGQKAIVASGFALDDRVQAIQKLGAGNYVQKPYTLEVLARAIRKELDK